MGDLMAEGYWSEILKKSSAWVIRFGLLLITGIVTFNASSLLLMNFQLVSYESWFNPAPVLSGFIAGLALGSLTRELKNGILLALLSVILGHLVYGIVLSLFFDSYAYWIWGWWWWGGLAWGPLTSLPAAIVGVVLAVLVRTMINERRID